jgi:hypothetical protein
MRKIFAAFVGLCLAGCSSYQLGAPKTAFRSIEVAPIRNSTPRPGTHAVLQGKITEALAADPRIKIGTGDAVLSTEVTQYRREGFTTKTGDAYTYTSYRVTFVVRCSLTTDSGRRVLFKDRDFSSVATLQLAGDSAAEELSLAPTLFANIASQIREAATTAW